MRAYAYRGFLRVTMLLHRDVHGASSAGVYRKTLPSTGLPTLNVKPFVACSQTVNRLARSQISAVFGLT